MTIPVSFTAYDHTSTHNAAGFRGFQGESRNTADGMLMWDADGMLTSQDADRVEEILAVDKVKMLKYDDQG